MMINLVLRSFFLFAAGLFTVLNGPLWLSVHARAFASGRQAPTWLHRGVSWLSRLVGLAILATWAWDSTDALKPTLLLCVAVAIGLFCLLDGPWRIITRVRFFRRGPEAPRWGKTVAIWFPRLGGAVVLFVTLATGIWAAVG